MFTIRTSSRLIRQTPFTPAIQSYPYTRSTAHLIAVPNKFTSPFAINLPLEDSPSARRYSTIPGIKSNSTIMSPCKDLSTNDIKLNAISRDFRTDTITIPTDDMFEAMKNATRGDDVYGEDPDTNELQDKVAKMAGKEAGLFCVSGTMTNQLAIRSHLMQPPHSILLDARSHVHLYEAGGVAFHSQATSLAIPPSNGHHLTVEEVDANLIRGEDIHSAPTKIISLENTLSGLIFPQEEIVKIGELAKSEGVIMHCDGARMWEVMAETGKSLEELCAPFDTVSLCLSKGLGAPIGSILVGPKKLIEKAKWFRKCFGGGIRQSGSLAIAASHCIAHHLPLLPATHGLARQLAQGLHELGVRLMLPVETQMVWIDTKRLGFDINEVKERLMESKSIRIGSNRLVVHYQIREEVIQDFLHVVKELKDDCEKEGRQGDDSAWNEEENGRFSLGQGGDKMKPTKAIRLGTNYGTNVRKSGVSSKQS